MLGVSAQSEKKKQKLKKKIFPFDVIYYAAKRDDLRTNSGWKLLAAQIPMTFCAIFVIKIPSIDTDRKRFG